MKVVLFAGGMGTRLWDYTQDVPKPMVKIGYRPILWHLMKYYAHFGHNDFILCLGYKADVVKEYFLNYNEGLSNDFILSEGGRRMELLATDIDDWRITFSDTGVNANVGMRLRAVRHLLKDEEMFLVNYADGLTDAPLDDVIDRHRQSGAVMTMMAVKPTYSFHVLQLDDSGQHVDAVTPISNSPIWINGGFYVVDNRIFEYLHEGADLTNGPLEVLSAKGMLGAYRYTGFWTAMDTFKDKQRLDDLYSAGRAPWELWKEDHPAGSAPRPLRVVERP